MPVKSKRRTPSVVTNHQYPYAVVDDAKQKMKWKPFKIHTPEIPLTNLIVLGRLCFLKEGS